ncbi:O-Antigen ligase [Pirellulimonas nuda]|uniref:O-Antigen ligase n=1 Tax=Pirellulimonas nuda TaxID=2528009 RepID=A0A518D7E3_9BACT|nr:O-antigen ligase family protein [Pirellulimonas nuda]QDU87402.1 O-Antigen ligase [Pirellulimonas nuda]
MNWSSAHRPSLNTLRRAPRWLSDAGLLGCLLLVPLAQGGRHGLGTFLYAACVAAALLGWIVHWLQSGRPALRGSWLLAVAGGAALLVVLQLIPLPTGLLHRLAPWQADALPLWQGVGEASFGTWQTLSIVPHESTEGLALLVTHALLLFTVLQRIDSREAAARLLKGVAIAAFAAALIGLAGAAQSQGALFGVDRGPQTDWLRGSFTNRNHFAHFLALGVGPLAALACGALASRKPEPQLGRPANPLAFDPRRWAPVVGLATVIAAVLLSGSRGGTLASAASLGVATLWLVLRGMLNPRFGWSLLAVAAAVLGVVSCTKYEGVTDRLEDLASVEEVDPEGGRRVVWAANIAAEKHSPWLGYGAGSHRFVYPLYLDVPWPREFTHAESGYLQVATETGLVGAALLLAALGVVAVWILRMARPARAPATETWLEPAVAGTLVASGLHALVDFVWYAPALLGLTVLQLAVACELARRPGGAQVAWRWRPSPLGVTAGVAALGVWAIATLLPAAAAAGAWDRYVRASQTARQLSLQLAQATEDDQAVQSASHARYINALKIEALREAVAGNPHDARARVRLAGALLQQFELTATDAGNVMSHTQARDAALTAGFAGPDETIAWLRRAFGERGLLLSEAYGHARQAVRLAPLEGEGYLYLADLTQFAPPAQRDRAALTQQGLAARPYSGRVQFLAGVQQQSLGRYDEALALFQSAFARPGSQRERIALIFATQISAAEFLEAFQPDGPLLRTVFLQYAARGDEGDMKALANYTQRLADESHDLTPRGRSAIWRHASEIYRNLGDNEQAIVCATRAYELAPGDFYNRLHLAASFVAAERFDDADPHLRWCLSRRPDVEAPRIWLAQGTKHRARQARAELHQRRRN